jgi:hypothetical protein
MPEGWQQSAGDIRGRRLVISFIALVGRLICRLWVLVRAIASWRGLPFSVDVGRAWRPGRDLPGRRAGV